ncbi:hypothetical protein [Streptomyces mirabilis]|uniref:hypothetical protein n=1 Tax=Streptomyces mirabilis TaxID=68239 RepID=UPI0036904E42
MSKVLSVETVRKTGLDQAASAAPASWRRPRARGGAAAAPSAVLATLTVRAFRRTCSAS